MPNPLVINAEYKSRFSELIDTLGRPPITSDKEYWLLSEWYKDQYDLERIARQKAENYERAQEKKLAANPVKVVEAICRTPNCDALIEPTGKRGRPPVFCLDCRNKKKGK